MVRAQAFGDFGLETIWISIKFIILHISILNHTPIYELLGNDFIACFICARSKLITLWDLRNMEIVLQSAFTTIYSIIIKKLWKIVRCETLS